MPRPLPRILAINGGSSSIKFVLFEAGSSMSRVLSGSLERIGLSGSTLRVDCATPGENFSRPVSAPDQATAVGILIDWITERDAGVTLAAVGHRIVHGGPNFSEPVLVTTGMLADLRSLTPFDPEHLSEELMLVDAMRDRFPDLPQVACFDTSFHRDMPRVARMLAIPRRYEASGIRRYGFHGLSYEFLMEELGRIGDPATATGRVVLAHLGSGASLAAVRDGRSFDTSMSFTPNSGVMMGTRSGDLDPGLALYLARTEEMSAQSFNDMVNSQSGLLGVSETSADMSDLIGREHEDARAAEAIALFCYQVKKCVGAFAAALGGLDTLVFTGGIGENAAMVRERVCDGLGCLGIELDLQRNAEGAALISIPAARVNVRVIHADEELMIARSVIRVLDACNGTPAP